MFNKFDLIWMLTEGPWICYNDTPLLAYQETFQGIIWPGNAQPS